MRNTYRTFYFSSLLVFALSGCSMRPDYSSLEVVGASASNEKVGNSCALIGPGYNFYSYTCTGWSAPAERCLTYDEEANKIVEQQREKTGQACRLIEVIRQEPVVNQ